MTSHPNRDRIEIKPLGTTYWSRIERRPGMPLWGPLPQGFEALAEIHRGDGSSGFLLRNKRTQILMQWEGLCLRSLPQRRALAALEGMSDDSKAQGERSADLTQ